MSKVPNNAPKKKKAKSKLLNAITNKVRKLFGGRAKSLEASVSQILSQSETIADSHEEERNILKNLVEFGDLEASDIMLPKAEIIALPITATFDQLSDAFISKGHSRIPIYKNSLDEVEGFIHIKDIFKSTQAKSHKKFKIEDLLRAVIFVPETIKAPDLLTKMKAAQIHIAIVLDEYGGTAGLVTIEDVVEELVGEIQDEHDSQETEQYIVKEGDHYVVDARVPIEDLEKALDRKLVDPMLEVEFDTLGGLVITYLGYIPKIGEKFAHHSGVEMEVLDSTNRRVKQVQIRMH